MVLISHVFWDLHGKQIIYPYMFGNNESEWSTQVEIIRFALKGCFPFSCLTFIHKHQLTGTCFFLHIAGIRLYGINAYTSRGIDIISLRNNQWPREIHRRTLCAPMTPYTDTERDNVGWGNGLLPGGTKPLPEVICWFVNKRVQRYPPETISQEVWTNLIRNTLFKLLPYLPDTNEPSIGPLVLKFFSML